MGWEKSLKGPSKYQQQGGCLYLGGSSFQMAGIVTEEAHWIVKKTKYNENPQGKFKNVYKINSD